MFRNNSIEKDFHTYERGGGGGNIIINFDSVTTGSTPHTPLDGHGNRVPLFFYNTVIISGSFGGS